MTDDNEPRGPELDGPEYLKTRFSWVTWIKSRFVRKVIHLDDPENSFAVPNFSFGGNVRIRPLPQKKSKPIGLTYPFATLKYYQQAWIRALETVGERNLEIKILKTKLAEYEKLYGPMKTTEEG